jgi:hypothetical protein
MLMKTLHCIIFISLSTPLNAFQKVDLNEASIEQIALLPGIGPGLSEKIVNYRQKNKGIKSIQELSSFITQKKMESILSLVVLKSPKPKISSQVIEELYSLKKRPLIPLKDLERAAFLAARLDNGLIEGLRERSRNSAWLPRLGLAFEVERDLDTAEKNPLNKPRAIEKRGGLDLGLGLRATFDLPEILFNRAELEIANLELRHLEKKEKIREKLHNLYFRYEETLRQGEIPQAHSNLKSIERSLEELAASLDSLSDGALSKYEDQNGALP